MKKRGHIRTEKLRSDILKILRKDARRKISEISRELGVASSTILNHIRKMEEDGTIKGYTVVSPHTDLHKLKSVVFVKARSPLVRHVAEGIAKIGEVLLLYEGSVTPTSNLFCLIHAHNPEHISEILFQVRHIDGVEHVESHVLTRKAKEKFYLLQ